MNQFNQAHGKKGSDPQRLRDLRKLNRTVWVVYVAFVLFALIFFVSLYSVEFSQKYRSEFFGSGFFFLALGFFFQFKKSRLLQKLITPSPLRPDPVLLLSTVGMDLDEFSTLVTLNLESLDLVISKIRSHITDLNEKIEEMGKDVGNVYTIVANLASEEVTLMDAVGKTSEEIGVMFEIVNMVIDEIQGRNKTMEDLVSKSREGGEKVKRTNEAISRITESSGGILKLIDFINGVSKETNLLAINASIEATHSGSEGKGFTVIADEIRKLATQTAQNSREITKLLSKNITDFGSATSASQDSGNAFEFIASEIHVVHGTIAEVVQSISELKTRGSVILAKSKSLDEIAERVRNTSGEVYGEVMLINNSLEVAKTLSDQIQKECEELSEAKDWLNRLTRKMQGKIVEIRTNTDRFISEEHGI